ncbi:hypothetical protein ABH15_10045 [Methanoculleus taiwanensis]|uniref:Uncharacterized protein n=1 Tax=Methanoculleus taiwanensis TaxID=1550565 RepID=A0A498H351_9EURY|nr:hypothetical protein [Methanoculleus taiwanensis]RXE56416.1 hypothetical protein ABH15_10045 [Methanoculleus taiwanensis]
MSRVIFTASLTDPTVAVHLESFKSSGGNISGLVQNLLKTYFEGGRELGGGSGIRYKLIEERLNSLVHEADTLRAELERYKRHVTEEETKRGEDTEALRVALEKMFDDVLAMGVRSWLRENRFTGQTPAMVVRKRINIVAQKTGSSYPEVAAALLAMLPEMQQFNINEV